LKSLEGVSISWPENDIKRPKLLNTSPMFLDLFRDKAICAGFTHEQFERNFKRIDGADLSYLPPGFSHEFLSYFEAREKILPTERMRLKELETEAMNLRKQQAELEKELCELEKSISASNSNTSPQPRVQSPVREQRVLLSWYSTMVALGVKKIRKPFTGLSHELCSPSKQHRASKTPSSKPSTSTVSPTACARSKTENIRKRVENFVYFHRYVLLLLCSFQCTDQHLLVMCDICKNHYHLACLDPPLAKMPKKNRNCGWECSICAEHSGEEDEQSEEESDKEQSVRKLRDRTDMNEKRKEEEKVSERCDFS
uniref:PHD finger protein 14 (inferred by orthology to a human protein) n=1 Tax=Anisakis simplex TaxID=6269 RepID=A0A0M3KEM7_ANISI